MSDRLDRAFDPDTLRRQGHALVDALADYLAAARRGEPPVLPWREPDAQAAAWPPEFPEEPAEELAPLLGRVVAESTHLHHPRFTGHQVTAPLPAAALAELVSALLNNSGAVYEMGPAAGAIEHALVAWMGRVLGLPAGADGLLTSGGSAGNLTALLAARQAVAGRDLWRTGCAGGPPLAVLVSAQAHYSVARAVQIMGLGAGGVVPVAVDDAFRLRPEALGPALDAATRAGLQPFAVVASAGSTATGAYDPLEPIAELCRARGLWLHVDGAHGAGAALSPRHRALVAGIERADSVVWDAHKMLLTPALVTGVLFREGDRVHATFAQEASYLIGRSARDEWYNLCHRTLECTKNNMGLKLYAALRTHGVALFREYLERCFELGQVFARLLEEAGDFELATWPQSNIVCFRHTPPGCADLDELQQRLRRRVIEAGGFYLVQTRLRERLYLRTTLINPFTEESDLRALLAALRAAA